VRDLDLEIAAREEKLALVKEQIELNKTQADDDAEIDANTTERVRLLEVLARARAKAITPAQALTSALADLDALRENGIKISDQELASLKASTRARLADKTAIAAAAKAQAERTRAERAAAQIRAKLGDSTQLLALREAELNRIARLTNLTHEEIAETLKKYQAQLDGTAALEARYKAITEAALSPVERLKAQIAELTKNYNDGRISLELYEATLATLEAGLDKATDAAHRNTKAFKDAEEIRKALTLAKQKALPIEQKLALEQERVNKLVKTGELNAREAATWMRQYGKELRAASGEAKLLANAQSVLDGIITGQIKSFDDLVTAFARALNQMIFDSIRANREIAGNQGLGGFVQNIFSTFLGFLGITGAVPTVPAGGGVGGGGLTVGAPASTPEFSKSPIVSGASAIQSITNFVQSPALAAPAPVAATGGLSVIVQNESDAEASAQTRQRGDGTSELLIQLRNRQQSDISSGRFDGVMNSRFGLRPVAGAR
jgi:hypothetical protein